MEEEMRSGCCHGTLHPKFILKVLGMVLLAAIVVVSILRDRFVSQMPNQVTVNAQGKAMFQPDEATVSLGVRVDNISQADAALNELNRKMAAISAAVKAEGVTEEDIKSGSYYLNPHYEYNDGKTDRTGYDAGETIMIKVKGINNDTALAGRVITAASTAGANDVNGVTFSVADIEKYKQEARMKAVEEAKKKAPEMFRATGVKAKKVVGWYENVISSPDGPNTPYPMDGRGGMAEMSSAAPSPQISGGTQEIVVEVGLNYEVK